VRGVKLAAIDARHDDVGQQQVDAAVLLQEHSQRRLGVICGYDAVIQIAKDFGEYVRTSVSSSDNEDRLTGFRLGDGILRPLPSPSGVFIRRKYVLIVVPCP
jgi:hypothetical protein